MSRIIILTDLTNMNAHNRYIGPYVIANHLERAGFDTVVIDFFTKHPNFFEYIKHFLDDETIAVCISTTFLTPPEKVRESSRGGRTKHFYSAWNLWHTSREDLSLWFEELKSLMSQYSPKAKLILGGEKVELLYKVPEMKLDDHPYTHIDYAVIGKADLTATALMKDLKDLRPQYTP